MKTRNLQLRKKFSLTQEEIDILDYSRAISRSCFYDSVYELSEKHDVTEYLILEDFIFKSLKK